MNDATASNCEAVDEREKGRQRATWQGGQFSTQAEEMTDESVLRIQNANSASSGPVRGRRGGGVSLTALYQSSFRPNWICLEDVAVPVTAPAAPETPEGVNTIRLGVLKFV